MTNKLEDYVRNCCKQRWDEDDSFQDDGDDSGGFSYAFKFQTEATRHEQGTGRDEAYSFFYGEEDITSVRWTSRERRRNYIFGYFSTKDGFDYHKFKANDSEMSFSREDFESATRDYMQSSSQNFEDFFRERFSEQFQGEKEYMTTRRIQEKPFSYHFIEPPCG